VLNGEDKGDRVQFVRGSYNQSYGSYVVSSIYSALCLSCYAHTQSHVARLASVIGVFRPD